MGRKRLSAGELTWSKTYWNATQFNIFLDLCVQGTKEGKRHGGGWGSGGYRWLQSEMLTRGHNFTVKQLKNKWDWMKSQWIVWSKLIGSEARFEWDPKKGTIIASDEWWREKIKENPSVVKLRDKGIGEDVYATYKTLFTNSLVPGEIGYASPSNILPSAANNGESNSLQLVEKSGDKVEDFVVNLDHTIQSEDLSGNQSTNVGSRILGMDLSLGNDGETSGGRRKKDETSSFNANKNKRAKGKRAQTDAEPFLKAIRNLRHTIEYRTAIMRQTFGESQGSSIPEVMADLLTLEGMKEGSDFHIYCLTLIEQKTKREVYSNLTSPQAKLNWLNFHYNAYTASTR